MMKTTFALTIAISFLSLARHASGQSFSIDWHTIDGGGGTSTGGVFAVTGSIGQPDANSQPMTGGDFSLTGGFSSVFALQTPGAPLLSVERQGGAVRIFWPLSATGFVLDQSPTVTGAWSQVSFPYVTNATGISFTAPTPTGNRVYRLRKP
jgi:hypothetical protein